ncbi:ParB N-terminal domain-containing protein [Qipengyuania aquimaris]|uniref:ParB N-terminal domain-containing protein n=1 Tax=Qipengyuania aquimaris TaxID=255984 RepID=UPI001C961CC2|nr:ParB N-terminal domain-containing protein [Qipengyuania aquimaris]MBY6127858.1 ParB N-terminal domain-containing protein [Qipengyuania aquimaris]
MELHPNAIVIGTRLRPLDEDAVKELAKNISGLGLQTPITVRKEGEGEEARYHLVAGYHRLAAAKRLGWPRIECRLFDGTANEAFLWEIAENLHRANLTKKQRDDHIRQYAEGQLKIKAEREAMEAAKAAEEAKKQGKPVKPSQTAKVSGPDKGGRGKKGIVTETAEALGIGKDTVRRALAAGKDAEQADKPQTVGPHKAKGRPTHPNTGETLSNGEAYALIMKMCGGLGSSVTQYEVAKALDITPKSAERYMREVAKIGLHIWNGAELIYLADVPTKLKELFPQWDWSKAELLLEDEPEPRT